MYLTESSPKHIRGSLGVLHQLGFTVGVLISQILGLEELLGRIVYLVLVALNDFAVSIVYVVNLYFLVYLECMASI